MKFLLTPLAACFFFFACSTPHDGKSQGPTMTQDPYIWLEDIYSPKVTAWLEPLNDETFKLLSQDPRYQELATEIRTIAASKDRIPYPTIRNGRYINFWQDEKNLRGILRETTESEFSKKEPHWETILDIDALNKKEGKSWVFSGNQCLPPDYNHCLVSLSDAGKDKRVLREFNLKTREFVVDGFTLPESKYDVSWYDENTLLVATDFGPGTLTDSGYAKQVKLWKRGTPLAEAELLFSGRSSDVGSSPMRSFSPNSANTFIINAVSFFEEEVYFYQPHQKLTQLPFPITSSFLGDFKGMILVKLRETWKTSAGTFSAGSVVSLPLTAIAKPGFEDSIEKVYEPDQRSTLDHVAISKSAVYLSVLKNVKSHLVRFSHGSKGWTSHAVDIASDGKIDISFSDSFSDDLLVTYQNFVTPPTLYKINISHSKPTALKSLPAQFDGHDIITEQLESTSADGTKIPYFLIHKKGMKLDGTHPTLLWGYGGFEISETPFYMGSTGKVWLEKGGVFAVANIRGGGEFGPNWHKAVLKEKRQGAYDDFISVSEDLISRKITSPRHLGIKGGSNGGLLVSAVAMQRPDLYQAVVCESALLDMIRYTKLPPGASWIAEYGDPEDPKMAEIISKYSPYQNIKKNIKYPKIFYYTSTADDRVQPGHSRKMVARLKEYGHEVLFYENREGGHGAAADIEQSVKKGALEYTYLFQQLF